MLDPLQNAPEPRQCPPSSTGNASPLVEVSRVVDGRYYVIREVPGRYLVKFFDHGEEAGGGSFPIESGPGDEVQDSLNAYCQAVDRGEDWLS